MTCSKPINYKQLIESNRYSNKKNEAPEPHHDNHDLWLLPRLSTVKLGPTDVPASTRYGKVLLLERSQNDTVPRVSLEGFPVPTIFLKQLLLQVIFLL